MTSKNDDVTFYLFCSYSDKIGSANFFWSFPSKSYQDRKTALENLTSALGRSRSSVEEVKTLIHEQSTDRQAIDRPAKMARLEQLKRREVEIDNILEASKANDPEELKRVKRCVEGNIDGANRWTDNIWVVKKYLTKKKGMQGKEVYAKIRPTTTNSIKIFSSHICILYLPFILTSLKADRLLKIDANFDNLTIEDVMKAAIKSVNKTR
jgi:Leucine zipper with capping helix domain